MSHDLRVDVPISCRLVPVQHSVLSVKALVGAFNQEKALVGAFSVIVQPVVEPMDRFAALLRTNKLQLCQHNMKSHF